jgi:hypothetical protein
VSKPYSTPPAARSLVPNPTGEAVSRKFKYVGPFDEVEIPAIGAVVKRGHLVVIDDPEISKGLDGQADWEPVTASKKKED